MNLVSKKIQLGIGSLLIAGAVAAGTPFVASAGSACAGDLNGDGRVGMADIVMARAQFGKPKADGTTFSFQDYLQVLQAYGTSC